MCKVLKMFYAKSNFTFLTAIIQLDKQNADRTYRQILQKTNQKQEKCMCSFRRSTGCFNQQSLLWSASPACVTTTLQPVDESTQVSSTKVNAVLKSQHRGSKLKVNAAAKTISPLTSIFVPGSTAFKNRTSHKFSACLDQVLTKVNAGQTSAKP